jgi:hypothetical protein
LPLPKIPLIWKESVRVPGARFAIRRLTINARIDLLERVRNLSKKIEFLEAGGTLAERAEAAYSAALVDKAYLNWGLVAVEGLAPDGEELDIENAADWLPEELANEVISAIKQQLTLSEQETKN